MKKDRWLLRAAALLALSAALMTGVSLAAEAGSSQDPLVTLSYLNDTFFNSIMQRVDQRIAERTGQALPGGGTASSASFVVVTLNDGQTLTGGVGCEVMLRIGGAVCVSPSDPGLIDETTAATLANGASLVQNHLYMMTIEGRGVRASGGTAKVLARGSYTVA
ncbi:hypothetical protein [Oscillibacter sp.]|uniref:hypothetical protein n=1 Tax=Oscillibacter sp. TaxID=1945593 RepID=UPI002D7E391B|nr:hypothetical protein [Oscillibacter sp.]